MATNMGTGPGNCVPGINKKFTTLCQMPKGGERPVKPAFSDHPSWITGLEALEEFHEWVARVVLPIAFQWIEEHKKEVYDKIDKKYEDDVGVVIAAAYESIRHREVFKNHEELMKDLASGKKAEPHISTLNPIWATITREVRAATKEIFEKEKPYLDDTI